MDPSPGRGHSDKPTRTAEGFGPGCFGPHTPHKQAKEQGHGSECMWGGRGGGTPLLAVLIWQPPLETRHDRHFMQLCHTQALHGHGRGHGQRLGPKHLRSKLPVEACEPNQNFGSCSKSNTCAAARRLRRTDFPSKCLEESHKGFMIRPSLGAFRNYSDTRGDVATFGPWIQVGPRTGRFPEPA